VFLAVNAFEPLEQALAFTAKTDLHYTWLRADKQALETLKIKAIPSQIILDRQGKVAWTSSLASLTKGADGVARDSCYYRSIADGSLTPAG